MVNPQEAISNCTQFPVKFYDLQRFLIANINAPVNVMSRYGLMVEEGWGKNKHMVGINHRNTPMQYFFLYY